VWAARVAREVEQLMKGRQGDHPQSRLRSLSASGSGRRMLRVCVKTGVASAMWTQRELRLRLREPTVMARLLHLPLVLWRPLSRRGSATETGTESMTATVGVIVRQSDETSTATGAAAAAVPGIGTGAVGAAAEIGITVTIVGHGLGTGTGSTGAAAAAAAVEGGAAGSAAGSRPAVLRPRHLLRLQADPRMMCSVHLHRR